MFAVALQGINSQMDVVLHIGAHRTASTSFQAFMRAHADQLALQSVGFWGPRRTRDGLFAGIMPTNGSPRSARAARLASGRIALALERARLQDLQTLVISDENVIGAPRRNIRDMVLYRDAGHRLARHVAAFGGRITRIALSIRGLDSFWPSTLAYGIARGHPLPSSQLLEIISQQTRGWRDVIGDLASAAPGIEIVVMPHETYGARPERRLELMLRRPCMLPRQDAQTWLNRAPDLAALRDVLALRGENPDLLGTATGCYHPFNTEQTARLRELYQDDLFWLHAGADGLATLMTEKTRDQTGLIPQRDTLARGHDDDRQKGRMA